MKSITRSLLLGTVSVAVASAAVDTFLLEDAEAGLTCMGSSCHATVSSASTLTDFSGTKSLTLDLPDFNSAHGTLTKVTIEMMGTINAAGTVTANAGSGTLSYTVKTTSTLTFGSLPDFGTGKVILNAQAVGTLTAPGTANYGSSPTSAHTTDSTTTGLAAYTGGGSFALTVSSATMDLATVHGSGNNSSTRNTFDTASVEVIYNFTPSGSQGIPEPASLVILGSGLAGLGVLRRRRGLRGSLAKARFWRRSREPSDPTEESR